MNRLGDGGNPVVCESSLAHATRLVEGIGEPLEEKKQQPSKFAEFLNPAPRAFACNSWRFEGPHEIDGRPALEFLVKSASEAYGVYILNYMVDTREIFCACKGAYYYDNRWKLPDEYLMHTGPLITRPREKMCRHMAMVKELLMAMARDLAREGGRAA